MNGKAGSYEKTVEDLVNNGHDISKRILKNEGGEICILFVKQLTDRIMLSNYIIKPIMEYLAVNKSFIKCDDIISKAIYTDDCRIENDFDIILKHLLNGFTIILFSNEDQFIIANIISVEKKSVESPELTYTIRGPRDSFTENLDVNLSLIRYRIKDPKFRIKVSRVGVRTNTRVAVTYIEDIANSSYVNDIINRVNKIDTDGIIESGELQAFLLNNKLNLFPQMGLAERSDMACAALLEGKVIILTEGSGIALIAPKTFGEFFQSCDDIYDNKFMGVFSKTIRIIAILMSFTLTSLYVAVVSFHSDILPGEYIITLATTRAGVPFNAFTEAIILEFITEVLREALLRVPKQIGPAIGIVGAIVIGQAAIAAGIFSPLILIISSISLLTSFVAPDYTIVNPLRILKFIMLFITGMFGLLGYTMGLSFIITNLISTNSFGIPYFTPYSPFNWYDFTRSIFYNKTIAPKRANFLRTKDNTRK